VADYSQLEIVIMAHLCVRLFGATGLRDRLYPGQPDMHSSTAKYVFGDILGVPEVASCLDLGLFKKDPVLKWFRDLVKRIRYGLAYGKGDYGFGNSLFELDAAGNIIGPPIGEEKASVFKNALLDMDPEVRQFQEWVWNYGYEHEMFPSLLGRWDPGPEIRGTNNYGKPSGFAKRKYRQWLNWPMQAGGQEVVFMVMIALAQAGLTMSLQVHDELHFMVDPDDLELVLPRIQEIGETTITLEAPLSFKPHAGTTWEEVK
jgi:DNA polymerase I-like protein with 3'-5' exonuclease and polymerase domains